MRSWADGGYAPHGTGRGAWGPRGGFTRRGRSRVGHGRARIGPDALPPRVPLPARVSHAHDLHAPRVAGGDAALVCPEAQGTEVVRAVRSGTPWKAFRRLGWLLADHAVAVAVAHVPVSGMRAGDGRDPMRGVESGRGAHVSKGVVSALEKGGTLPGVVICATWGSTARRRRSSLSPSIVGQSDLATGSQVREA